MEGLKNVLENGFFWRSPKKFSLKPSFFVLESICACVLGLERVCPRPGALCPRLYLWFRPANAYLWGSRPPRSPQNRCACSQSPEYHLRCYIPRLHAIDSRVYSIYLFVFLFYVTCFCSFFLSVIKKQRINMIKVLNRSSKISMFGR